MTQFTIATFNVKNLIGPNKEYYRFQQYTPEEYAWKEDWLADQLLSMNADIVGFQEVFEPDALATVLEETNKRATALNEATIPDRSKRYHRKVIFRKLEVEPYNDATFVFAPNVADDETKPGERRPGLALLSRFELADEPEIVQDLDAPVVIPFKPLRGISGDDAGFYRLRRLSRPILKVRLKIGRRVVSVFNCHLKSKLGEYVTPPGAEFAPEENLLAYDPVGRALGSMRSAVRRLAEAWVLRKEVVAEIEAGYPVIVLGDFNDGEHAVSSEIISGERPFRNYAWMLRHDAKAPDARYSREEHEQITEEVERVRLQSAETLFIRKSARDMVYTTAFGGVYESLDRILLSRAFDPDHETSIGEMEYLSVFNDHITDGSHAEAPYNKLVSDHGQIMAHIRLL